MSLTVADIDRWDAQAVREVFHAATARAQVSLEVSRQLATLSILPTPVARPPRLPRIRTRDFAAISTPTVMKRWQLRGRRIGPLMGL